MTAVFLQRNDASLIGEVVIGALMIRDGGHGRGEIQIEFRAFIGSGGYIVQMVVYGRYEVINVPGRNVVTRNDRRARMPVSDSPDAQPAFAPSLAYKAVDMGLMSISNARYMAKVVMRMPAAICPGPIAEMNADSANIKIGISTVCFPTSATTFLENRSSVPLLDAMPNRNVTPTSVTNMELTNPAVICLAVMPPDMPRM